MPKISKLIITVYSGERDEMVCFISGKFPVFTLRRRVWVND